jgi:hypothetical protein
MAGKLSVLVQLVGRVLSQFREISPLRWNPEFGNAVNLVVHHCETAAEESRILVRSAVRGDRWQ